MSHFEPGACLSLWPTGECEWSSWDIWRSSDVVEHVIYLSLALMLGCTFFVLIRFAHRYYLDRRDLRASENDSALNFHRKARELILDLSRGLGTLNGITYSAPFLGLAGTCYGIMGGAFMGFSMEKRAVTRMLMANIAASLATSAAGILVAIPATLTHNFIWTRLEALRSAPLQKGICDEPAIRLRSIKLAQNLPLRRRFSDLPPFALLTAPALSCAVAIFMAFEPYEMPTGLTVAVPSFPCHPGIADRIIVLRVTNSDELFLNTEPVSWTDLPRRLSAIYGTRASRELWMHAGAGASFQTVADAIDTVRNIRDPNLNLLDIKVLLITPQAETDNEKCFARFLDRLRQSPLEKSK